jgi:hypothetical protein
MTSPDPGGLAVGDLHRPIPAASFTVQRPTLAERADRLTTALDILQGQFKGLREKLEPVTLPSGPTAGPSDKSVPTPRDPDSWLADFLTSATSDVTALTSQLQDLTARVDL